MELLGRLHLFQNDDAAQMFTTLEREGRVINCYGSKAGKVRYGGGLKPTMNEGLLDAGGRKLS